MSNDKTPRSPYKKLKSRNTNYVGYVNMDKLAPNKLYKIFDLVPTNHPTYGEGQMAFLEETPSKKWKVQLPGKYLKQLDPEDINIFKTDIKKGKCPFLIFRERMADNSFRIDIVEDSPEMRSKFCARSDIEELNASLEITDETSVSVEEQNQLEGLPCKKHKPCDVPLQ